MKNILIVDDSESVRKVVQLTLENAGYSVKVGVDGQDAHQYLDGSKIDLVITDLHMPNKDGISLIRDIRAKEEYQYTPVLLLTTESQQEKKMEAKEAGATGWIVKPFAQDKLLTTVKKVIR